MMSDMMQTNREKVSYCIGLETGKNIRQQFADMDEARLLEGFKAAINEEELALSDSEIENVMEILKKQIEKQQREFVVKLAEKNKKDGEAFLAENKAKPGITTLPSGLQYRVIESGSGATPRNIDMVTAHYKGRFISGQVFENSYDREKAPTFAVTRVLPGWSEALQQMKVGDKWEIFIPHWLAYGEAGFGNHIGPNTTLIFEIELLDVNPT